MNTFVIFFAAVVAAASAQRSGVDPKNAAILAEARYLSGDGSFGSAYVQEDNTEFKEETGQDGERKGQYSYVDPNGKKITVHYTAGKGGFQVSGDHLPKAPAPLPIPAAHQRPAPQYNSQPQYNSIPQQQGGSPNGQDGQYYPELFETPYLNENGASGQRYQQAQYNPAPQQQQARPAPQQYNQNQGFNYQHQANNYQQQPIQTTTPYPNRFFPPGKLDLNRTPQGFNFQFQSNGRQ